MSDYSQMTDEAVLSRLGERLSRFRLDRNLSQADLATEAGVHKNTVFRLEAGGSTQLKNLVRVLRVLGLLDGVDALVPEAVPSPLRQLEARGRRRKRAVSRPDPKSDLKPDRGAAGRMTEWSWRDEGPSDEGPSETGRGGAGRGDEGRTGEPNSGRDGDQNPGGGS